MAVGGEERGVCQRDLGVLSVSAPAPPRTGASSRATEPEQEQRWPGAPVEQMAAALGDTCAPQRGRNTAADTSGSSH